MSCHITEDHSLPQSSSSKSENLSDFHDTGNPLNLINQSVSRASLGMITCLQVQVIELEERTLQSE